MTQRARLGLRGLAAGGALTAVGTFMPWYAAGFDSSSVATFGTQQSSSGLSYTDWATVVLITAAWTVWVAIRGRSGRASRTMLMLTALAAVGIAAVVIAIARYLGGGSALRAEREDLGAFGQSLSFYVRPGLGLWVCLAGSILLFASSLVLLSDRRFDAVRREAPAEACEVVPSAARRSGLSSVDPAAADAARARWAGMRRTGIQGYAAPLIAGLVIGFTPVGSHLMDWLAPRNGASEQFFATALLITFIQLIRLPFLHRNFVQAMAAGLTADLTSKRWWIQRAAITAFVTLLGTEIFRGAATATDRRAELVGMAAGIVVVMVGFWIRDVAGGARVWLVGTRETPADVHAAAAEFADRLGLRWTPVVRIGRLRRADTGGMALGGTPFRVILSDELAMNAPYQQMRGVLAHELAHCYRHDLRNRVLRWGGWLFVVFVAVVGVSDSPRLLRAVGADKHRPIEMVPLLVATALLTAVICRAAELVLCRREEARADVLAAQWCGDGQALIDFLAYHREASGAPERWSRTDRMTFATHPSYQARRDALASQPGG